MANTTHHKQPPSYEGPARDGLEAGVHVAYRHPWYRLLTKRRRRLDDAIVVAEPFRSLISDGSPAGQRYLLNIKHHCVSEYPIEPAKRYYECLLVGDVLRIMRECEETLIENQQIMPAWPGSRENDPAYLEIKRQSDQFREILRAMD